MELARSQSITLQLPVDMVERIDALHAGLQAEQQDRRVERSEVLSWILARGLSAIERDQEALL